MVEVAGGRRGLRVVRCRPRGQGSELRRQLWPFTSAPASARAAHHLSHPLPQPRWGRNLECAGEDPLLSGEYAINFVQGFEHAKETPYPLQASACCKHYVANELESWNGTDRTHMDAHVPQQDLVDSYLPPFQACVEQGKVTSVMCR